MEDIMSTYKGIAVVKCQEKIATDVYSMVLECEEAARQAEEAALRQEAIEAAAAQRRTRTAAGIAVVAVLLVIFVLVLRRSVRGRGKKSGSRTRK